MARDVIKKCQLTVAKRIFLIDALPVISDLPVAANLIWWLLQCPYEIIYTYYLLSRIQSSTQLGFRRDIISDIIILLYVYILRTTGIIALFIRLTHIIINGIINDQSLSTRTTDLAF